MNHSPYRRYSMQRVLTVSDIVTADYIDNEIIEGTDIHLHEEAWELLLCKTGSLGVYQENGWITLRSNECLLIRPGVIHDVTTSSKDTSAFVVSFICSDSDCLMPLEHRKIAVRQRNITLIDLMMEELTETFQIDTVNLHLTSFHSLESAPFGSEQIICSYLEQILIFMIRDCLGEEQFGSQDAAIRPMMESYLVRKIDIYIRENYHRKETGVSTVASYFNYSRTRISTLYKKATGHSLHDVICDMRLRKSKQLLEETDLSVAEIAAEAGFGSPQYFTNKFKSETGMSPTAYREKML